MSKSKLWFSSAMMVLTLGLLPVTAVNAQTHGPGTSDNNISSTKVGEGFISTGSDANSQAQARSTAEFNVQGGDLTLDSVPDFQFGSVKTSAIITGDQTLHLSDNNVSKNAANLDGNNTGHLSITDYTGSNNGWHVVGALGQFKNTTTSGAVIDQATLALSPSTATSDNSQTAQANKTTLTASATDTNWGTDAQAIWTAAANQGQGQNTTTYVDTNNTLTIGKQTNIAAGTYQATLYWALQNVPTAPAAN
ncbi:WxL domain-containing protein [Furfurilactobacillus curtus]|uniref:Cell surface protein n=1 Tax=Furfurilactobacillus curtus TaxID=1746200 RepID=A0ABQ5JNY1_9LACO